jgi:hypothetical protein
MIANTRGPVLFPTVSADNSGPAMFRRISDPDVTVAPTKHNHIQGCQGSRQKMVAGRYGTIE